MASVTTSVTRAPGERVVRPHPGQSAKTEVELVREGKK